MVWEPAVKPRIAITMGDPGGIGPEVILKALARSDVRQALIPVIVGDLKVLGDTARRLNLGVPFHRVDAVDEAVPNRFGNAVAVWQPTLDYGSFLIGGISAENGKASRAYILEATQAALEKKVDSICTAPISKEALFAAGSGFPGHTELLADACGVEAVRMMLAGGGLRVVLQTIHVALKDVPALISIEAILKSLRMISQFATAAGESHPRIAVCGLNPHAGEGGHFGTEEITIIAPAVAAALDEGIAVTGPLPADTVFHRMLQGDFDFVLAMYHDQGLIPVKTLDFHGGVNVTVGLPIFRTSPDHGTAFNLVGQNLADESSMAAALLYAVKLASYK